MLRSRLSPCLLLSNGGLYKTTQFSSPKYIGDPLNAVRIFNDLIVDELVLFDISASSSSSPPDFGLIARLAAECRMPLTYGGGVTKPSQVEKLVRLGVEKVSISSSAFSDPNLVSDSINSVGSQSVAVTLDVRPSRFRQGNHSIYVNNGKRKVSSNILRTIEHFQDLGVGELFFNSIVRDGTLRGYDLDLVKLVAKHVTIPFSILGGLSSLDEISRISSEFGPLGISAGALFCFKGKHRAVLLQYPDLATKLSLTSTYSAP